MNKWWIIGIVLIVVIILFVVIILTRNVRHGEYVEISYSSSGNMLGNTDETELDIKEKIVTTRFSQAHNEPIHVVKYKVEDKDIEEILEVVESYNYLLLSKRKTDTRMIALDGPSTNINIVTNDKPIGGYSKEYHRIYYDYKLSKKEREKIRELQNKLLSFVKEENKIDEFDEEQER